MAGFGTAGHAALRRGTAFPQLSKEFSLPDPGPLLHGQFEINGIRFGIDPQAISVSEQNFNHQYQTLRTREAAKVRSGHSRLNISVRAVFTGISVGHNGDNTAGHSLDEINRTLMPILYSLKKMPMCFLDNEVLRRNLPVLSYFRTVNVGGEETQVLTGENIAAFVRSVNVSTVPGMPETLSVEFQFVWFNHRPFTPAIRFRKSWTDPQGKVEGFRRFYGNPAPSNRNPKLENHAHRHEFIQNYGHPSIAFNCTAAHTSTMNIHEARPLHEYLWPYLYESSNPSQDQLKTQYDLQKLPPYVLSDFDKTIEFGFRIIRNPTQNVLDALDTLYKGKRTNKPTSASKAKAAKAAAAKQKKLASKATDVPQAFVWPLPGGDERVGDGVRDGRSVRRKVGGRVIKTAPRRHRGVDIYAPVGTNVLAAGEGTIHYVGWGRKGKSPDSRSGLFIEIRHEVGGVIYYTRYLHLKDGSATVKRGDKVNPGQKIAEVGLTGVTVSNPHLHFEIRKLNPRGPEEQDPISWLQRGNHGTVASRTKISAMTVASMEDAADIIAEDQGFWGEGGKARNESIKRYLRKQKELPSETKEAYSAILDLANEGWELFESNITGKKALISNVIIRAPEGSQSRIPMAINIGFGTNVTMTPLQGQRFPTAQYVGGQHTAATIEMRLEGEDGRLFLSLLKSLVNSTQEASINFREFIDKRGVEVSNTFLNGMNINRVMIEDIFDSTIPGNPDGLNLSIRAIDSTINPATEPLLLSKGGPSADDLIWKGFKLLLRKGWLDLQSTPQKEEFQVVKPLYGTAFRPNVDDSPAALPTYTSQVDAVAQEPLPALGIRLIRKIADALGSQKIKLDPTDPGEENIPERIKGELYEQLYKRPIPLEFKSSVLPEQVWVFLFGGQFHKGKLLDRSSSNSWVIRSAISRLINVLGRSRDGKPLDRDFALLYEQTVTGLEFNPANEAYPDLQLPPNPISGLVTDTTPDFFLYNESDVKQAKTSVLKFVHGKDLASFARQEGLEKSLLAIEHTAKGVRQAYGLEAPQPGGIRPLHEGRENVYLDENGSPGPRVFKTRHKDSSIIGNDGSIVRGDSPPDTRAALVHDPQADPDIAETNVGTRMTGASGSSSYDRSKHLDFAYQNSPHKDNFTEDPYNLNKLQHIFQEEEYKRIFKEFTENYESEHYAVRRAFPTFKVFFVDEAGELSRNDADTSKKEAKLVSSFALDDFYGVNAVKEIRVVHNKNMSASVAMVQILDLDGVLFNRKYLPSSFGQRMTKTKAKRNPYLDTVIKEGMKIIIKMGFSNDPNQLETVFVGQIVSWEGSHLIELICQSYGSELVSHNFGTDPNENADFWNVTSADLLHDMMDREELRHFGRWELKDIDLFGAVFGHEKLRPDGQTKKVWTWRPSVVDDNLFVPEVDTYLDKWDILWGDVEYVFWNTTIWDTFKEMELRHPGYIAYPVPYGDGLDARMTMFFGHPSMEYLSRPPGSRGEKEAELSGINTTDVHDAIVQVGRNTVAGSRGSQGRFAAGLEAIADQNERVGQKGLQALARHTGTNVDDLALVAPHARKQYQRLQQLKQNTNAASYDAIPADKFRKATMLYQNGRMRPFRNYELISSVHDIIQNNVRCDHRDTFNSVELRYTSSGFFTRDDVDIDEFSRGVDVDSIIVNVDDNVKEHHIRRTIESWPNCTTGDMARRYASQLMANSLKRTYKGELLVMGRPKLKPYDVLWLWDNYSDMAGPVEVEEVVHTISSETGFTTEIVPNMIVAVKEEVTPLMVDAVGAFFNENLKEFTNGAIIGFSGVAGGGLLYALGRGGVAASASGLNVNNLLAPGALQTVVSRQVALDSISTAGLATLGAGGAVVIGAQQPESNAPSAGAGVITGAGVGLGMLINPLVPCAAGLIAGSLLYKYLKYNLTREPVIITPLIKQGKPFVTGVEGMESDGLVVSDLFSGDAETAAKARKNLYGRKWKYFVDGIDDADEIIARGFGN